MTNWKKGFSEDDLQKIRNWFSPTFGFTLTKRKPIRGTEAQHIRAIKRLLRGFPSVAIHHDGFADKARGRNVAHYHCLVALPEDRRQWFLETLEERFSYENRAGFFQKLQGRDIQHRIEDAARIWNYAWDTDGLTIKNPQIAYGFVPDAPSDAVRQRNTSQKEVVFCSPAADTSPLPHRVRKRVPA